MIFSSKSETWIELFLLFFFVSVWVKMPHFFNALIFWQKAGSVIITSLENIIRTEGLKGMYRGLSPTILALLPNWAVSITFLEFLPKKNQ